MRRPTDKELASALSDAGRRFLLEHAAGTRPAVPDCVWHGADAWVLARPHHAWTISGDGKRALRHLQGQAWTETLAEIKP